MKGDFSRQTFDPTRHYTTVRLQQGRVQLDADFNEQTDAALHRVETEAADIIGDCGGPLEHAAFAVVVSLDALSEEERASLEARFPEFTLEDGDLILTAGRYYVDGMLCEVEEPVPFTRQPDRPPLAPLDVTTAGATVLYLDVWQRHVTWLDDLLLRETALGGPDTATRTKTVWQVRAVPVEDATTTCADAPPEYLAATAPSTGLLAARARREDTTPDPCLIPATAGFRGLENQLYRVEVHAPGAPYDLSAPAGEEPVTVADADHVVYTGGTWSAGQVIEVFRSAGGKPMEGWLATIVADDEGTSTLTLDTALPDLGPADAPRIRPVQATYKWSRDNGSVVTAVTSVTGRDVVLTSLGPDEVLSFAPGHWVELQDDAGELEGLPGFLAQIAAVDPDARTVTLRSDPPADGGSPRKLRRWDGVGALKVRPPAPAEPFAELEDGVQVRFEAGDYRTGDHWVIPARTATQVAQSGNVEWPVGDDGEPVLRPPAGIRHHYCRLAILQSDGETLTATDCRDLFPPVTELTTLLYAGGDGQEARPGQPVPQALQAGVFRGRHPVAGATVRFATETGGAVAGDHASLPSGEALEHLATTDADGIATCAWRPANDLARLSQRVDATLLDAALEPVAAPLRFSGQLSVAAEVAYVPGACADLAGADTVQEALDILCARPGGGESCCRVVDPETSIEQVLDELRAAGERHVALCLTAGNHALGAAEVSGFETVVIDSCGAGAVLTAGQLGFQELRRATLHDLDVRLVKDEPVAFRECREVTIERCRIDRFEVPGPAVVIGGAQAVRISDSILDGHVQVAEVHPFELLDDLLRLRDRAELDEAALKLARRFAAMSDADRKRLSGEIAVEVRQRPLHALERTAYAALAFALRDEPTQASLHAALARLIRAAAFATGVDTLGFEDPGAETLLDRCDVVGQLSLYAARATRPLELDPRALRELQQSGRLFLRGSGALHLRSVRLTSVALGDRMVDRIESVDPNERLVLQVLRLLHTTDCEVLAGPSAFLATDVTMTALDFRPEGDIVGSVIGDTAIITATRGGNVDTRIFLVAGGAAVHGMNLINVIQL